jgi:hypothetical protein
LTNLGFNYILTDPVPLDEEVLLELESRFKFARDYAVQCLRLNRHNQVTTTYYLLLRKRDRGGSIRSVLPTVQVPLPTSRAVQDFSSSGDVAQAVVVVEPLGGARASLPDADRGAGSISVKPVPKLELSMVKDNNYNNTTLPPAPNTTVAGLRFNLNPPTFRGLPGAAGHRYQMQVAARPPPPSARGVAMAIRPPSVRSAAPKAPLTAPRTSRVPAASPVVRRPAVVQGTPKAPPLVARRVMNPTPTKPAVPRAPLRPSVVSASLKQGVVRAPNTARPNYTGNGETALFQH